MIYLLLDILLYNYTSLPAFFFLTNLNKRSFIYNLAIAIIIDFLILKTYGLNMLIIFIFYLLRKSVFKINFYSYFSYVKINLLFTICYYLITNFFFSFLNLKVLIMIIILHIVFYSICYIKDYLNI